MQFQHPATHAIIAASDDVAAAFIAVIAVIGIIAFFVLLFAIRKRVIASYPIRAQATLGAHLEPGEGDLVWVYGKSGPKALTKFLTLGAIDSRCFLLGLTQRRLLLLRTTDRLQPLGFAAISFASIKSASVEDSADPWKELALSSAMSGKILHFELQDGTKFSIGCAYQFPAFPAHRGNLEKIAAFLAKQEFRTRA